MGSQLSMLAMLIKSLRVTLIFAIFVNYAYCETNQEFRDLILEKVAVQDEKIQKQDEKIVKQDEKIQQLF